MLTIRDPIHGAIEVPPWAQPLIDHPVMQRLRRVHQLGTAHLVYPGAHHRRFEHSLGASHMAGRFAQALGFTPHDRDTVRAAALLHDVGHGPFSHAFEELVREQGMRHEHASMDLIRWGPLADLLRKGGLDPVRVAETVGGKGRLAPLVSGSIDADRTDYLLRDAHYTGVPTSVDAQRIAEVLHLDADGILLHESGLTAAEALLTTRFLMYPAVYLHHTVRATESMLLAAVRLHVAAGHATFAELALETDDGLLWRMRQAGGPARDLVQRLDERRLHKRAAEVRPDSPAAAALIGMAHDGRQRLQLAARIAEAAGVDASMVLVDVPHPPRLREGNLRVLGNDGTVRQLAEASRLVAVLQEARMDHWRAWVFAPKADCARVAAAASRELAALAPTP